MSTHPAILIVSRYFAPSAAVGAKRFSFLVREFEQRGYETQVVTAEVDARDAADRSLPVVGSVHRCRPTVRLPLEASRRGARYVNRIARTLLAPLDLDAFWIGPAARLGVREAARAGTGVVIATAPPFSAALAGARIAAQCRWPLVLDYRNPYSAFPGSAVCATRWLGRLPPALSAGVSARASLGYSLRQRCAWISKGCFPMRRAKRTS